MSTSTIVALARRPALALALSVASYSRRAFPCSNVLPRISDLLRDVAPRRAALTFEPEPKPPRRRSLGDGSWRSPPRRQRAERNATDAFLASLSCRDTTLPRHRSAAAHAFTEEPPVDSPARSFPTVTGQATGPVRWTRRRAARVMAARRTLISPFEREEDHHEYLDP